jgi:hypothetical protein
MELLREFKDALIVFLTLIITRFWDFLIRRADLKREETRYEREKEARSENESRHKRQLARNALMELQKDDQHCLRMLQLLDTPRGLYAEYEDMPEFRHDALDVFRACIFLAPEEFTILEKLREISFEIDRLNAIMAGYEDDEEQEQVEEDLRSRLPHMRELLERGLKLLHETMAKMG